MARVKIVNRQEIDGEEVKRGQVITVSDGHARDLINAGKAVPAAEAPKPAPVPKEGKNA